MDLDKVKKEWREKECKPHVTEEAIGRMIDNQGQNAFNKLLKYERLSFIALLICVPITLAIGYLEVKIVLGVSLFFILIWQIYKYRFLQKADLLRMSVMEVSHFYLRYRRYIAYELVVSIIWFFAFTLFFGLMQYKYAHEYFMDIGIYVFVILFVGAFLVAVWIVWKLYLKNLRQLGRSVRILEEMERTEENEENENSNQE